MKNPKTAKTDVATRREYRSYGRQSIQAFGDLFLSHYLKHEPCQFHKELYETLQDISGVQDQMVNGELIPAGRRNSRIAIAAPRGSAKSTIVNLVYVLWAICYKKETFIIIGSDTAGQAFSFLSDIKSELENNSLLSEVFPEAFGPPLANDGLRKWTEKEIITQNDVKIVALGRGNKVRGLRFRENRPSMIILDDVEGEDSVKSPDQREKTWNWLKLAVEHAGDEKTNYLFIGTILHYASALSRLLDPKTSAWQSIKYQAVIYWSENDDLWNQWREIFNDFELDHIDRTDKARSFFEENKDALLEGTEVFWPEREDYYALMVLLETVGAQSFNSEKQNEPINPKDCFFSEDDFMFWDDDEGINVPQDLIDEFEGNHRVAGACDPSLGKKSRKGDYSAILNAVQDSKTGIIYITDDDQKRRTPNDTIVAIINYHAERAYQTFGFETNGFQEYMKDELVRQSTEKKAYIPVKSINHTTDKGLRIERLQPLIKRGIIRFSKKHRMLLEQLKLYPLADHDDGPDALEMLVSLVERTNRVRATNIRRNLPRQNQDTAWDRYVRNG